MEALKRAPGTQTHMLLPLCDAHKRGPLTWLTLGCQPGEREFQLRNFLHQPGIRRCEHVPDIEGPTPGQKVLGPVRKKTEKSRKQAGKHFSLQAVALTSLDYGL